MSGRLVVCLVLVTLWAPARCLPVTTSEDLWAEAPHLAFRRNQHAELTRYVQAQVMRIPASEIDRLAIVVKPCMDNELNCRYNEGKIPQCDEYDKWIAVREIQEMARKTAWDANTRLKEGNAIAQARFGEAQAIYERPSATDPNKPWSLSSDTTTDNPLWAQYDAARAAALTAAAKVTRLADVAQKANAAFAQKAKLTNEAYAKTTVCAPAASVDIGKAVEDATVGSSTQETFYLSLPYFSCTEKKTLPNIQIQNEAGVKVDPSACSNFGFTEGGCKRKCARAPNCAWALFDGTKTLCGENGYCGLNVKTTDQPTVAWATGKACERRTGPWKP